MASQPPDLLLDLDLDLGFSSQDFSHALQDDLNLLEDTFTGLDGSNVGTLQPGFFRASGAAEMRGSTQFATVEATESAANRESARQQDPPNTLRTNATKLKRLRKSEKDRLTELEERVTSLQKVLEEGKHTQEELLLQEANLAAAANSAAREQGGPAKAAARKRSPGLPGPDDKFWLLDLDGIMQHMTCRDIAELSNEDSIAIYEIYVSRLGDMLAQRQNSLADEEIMQLAAQARKIPYLKSIYKPRSLRVILNYNRLGLDTAEKKHIWSKVLEGLNLSREQRHKALHFRRLFLESTSQLLQSRQQLLASLKESESRTCCTVGDLTKQTSACQRIMKQLQDNLHADQNVLSRLFNQVFDEVLKGIQKAIILVEFWPCSFDLVGLLNQLAEEDGDTATLALLGLPAKGMHDCSIAAPRALARAQLQSEC
ncbi:hypothetical protein WJX74_009343 [Apatococcus lobatus]|uniref:Uncharacterized protein n=1 Tax=Apatococcus lobatus TaxID=904363 RepID=A0AAW1SC84_9CHLO